MERPEIVTQEHLKYLDNLRESGTTNMFGAPEYVHNSFDVTRQEAREIVKYWMETFGDDEK